MSDQVQDEPGGQASHDADVEAGFDDGIEGDDTTKDGVDFAPAGVPRADLGNQQSETSHDADVEAGYDDQASDDAGDR